MNNENYKDKYLKYKSKYLNIKNIDTINENDTEYEYIDGGGKMVKLAKQTAKDKVKDKAGKVVKKEIDKGLSKAKGMSQEMDLDALKKLSGDDSDGEAKGEGECECCDKCPKKAGCVIS